MGGGGAGGSVAGEEAEGQEAGGVSQRAHLKLVDTTTGEATDACLACVEKDRRLAQLSRKVTELQNLADKIERRHPLDAQIMEVCLFHKQLLSPTWKIVRMRGAYKDVGDRLRDIDAETGEPAWTPLHLRAASVGMSMSEWCRQRGIRSASWLFGSTRHVQWMLEETIGFKRAMGTSALEIVDQLGRPGLEKLAAVCDCCGHLRLDHEKERPELDLFDPPCAVHGCACPGWQDFDWRVRVRMAELEREREPYVA